MFHQRLLRATPILIPTTSTPLHFNKFTTQPVSSSLSFSSSSSSTQVFCNSHFDISKYKDWLHPKQVLKLFTQRNHPDQIFSLFHKLSNRPDYLPSIPLYTLLLKSLSSSPYPPPFFSPHLHLLLHHLYRDQNTTTSWIKPTFPDHFFFTLISFYSSISPSHAASLLLHMRQYFDCTPSPATFNLALKIAISARLFPLARHIYLSAPSLGVFPDPSTLTILAEGLFCTGEVVAALRLVEEFPLPPETAAESVVGLMDIGRNISGEMYRDVVRDLMEGGRYGEVKKAMEIMVRWGVNPKRGVYKSVLKGLAEMGLWDDVGWVLGQMACRGYGPGLAVWSHLLPLLSLTMPSHPCNWQKYFLDAM